MGKKIKRSALNRIIKEETQRYFLEKRVKQKLVQEGFLDEEVPAPIDFGDKPEPVGSKLVHPLDDGDYGEKFYRNLLGTRLQRVLAVDGKYVDPEIYPKNVSQDNKIGGEAIAKAYALFKKTGYEEITPEQAEAELEKSYEEYREKAIKTREEDDDDWPVWGTAERVWRATKSVMARLIDELRTRDDEKYAREKKARIDFFKSEKEKADARKRMVKDRFGSPRTVTKFG